MALETIATLAADVQSRMQDPNAIFWLQSYEYYSAVAEAISDLLLLIGRPTQQTSTIYTLTPSTVWQPMPPNMLAITNIRSSSYSLWKTSLHAMDYTQASWGPDWESDTSNTGPLRWGPLGLTYFFVHPAPTIPIQVTVTGVAYPITTPWPPTGAETSPFHTEINVAIQMYAAWYLALKTLPDESLESEQLFNQYLDIAQRNSTIEDRRDPLVFSRAFGTPTAPSLVSLR
jgi:hypothetical protein